MEALWEPCFIQGHTGLHEIQREEVFSRNLYVTKLMCAQICPFFQFGPKYPESVRCSPTLLFSVSLCCMTDSPQRWSYASNSIYISHHLGRPVLAEQLCFMWHPDTQGRGAGESGEARRRSALHCPHPPVLCEWEPGTWPTPQQRAGQCPLCLHR